MRTALLLAASLVTIMTAGSLLASEEIQTDWAGGPGESGPVADWTDRHASSSDISWLAVPGQLALTSTTPVSPVEHLINDAYYGSFGMHPADIDGDGDTDVLGAADASGAVLVWLNQGTQPVTWSEQIIDNGLPGASAVFPADLDGDGHTDVVGTATSPSQVIIWWRNGGDTPITWTPHLIELNWINAFEIYADDVDRDGDQDVLSCAWDSSGGPPEESCDVAWWRNDGGNPIVWTRQDIAYDYEGGHSIKTADFDGDQDTDLVVAAGIDDQIAWWRNDGGDPITWTKQTIRLNYAGARSVCAEDIDGDGDPDVIATAWDREITWWRNDGGSPISWHEQVIAANFNGGHSVDVADLNGDGRLDVLGAACLGHDIKWYANGGGDPITWTPYFVDGNCTNTVTVRSADIDGDGAVDVLGTSYYWGQFIWWDVTQFTTSGELTGSILDTEGDPELTFIDWSAIKPPGTELRFQLRSSNDPVDLGSWSAEITTPGNLGVALDRYVQYRMLFESTDPAHSPILQAIVLSSDPAGIPGPAASASRPTPQLGGQPNPFNPRVEISFGLDSTARARLAIFDIAGRQVARLADRSFAAGMHQLTWNGRDDRGGALPSGTYLVQLATGETQETLKLVLLR